MTQDDDFIQLPIHGTVKEKIAGLEQISEGTKIMIWTDYRDEYGGEDSGEYFAGLFKKYTGDSIDNLVIEITSPYKMPRGYDENEQPFSYFLKQGDDVMAIPWHDGDGGILDDDTQYITAILKLKDQNLTVKEMCKKFEIDMIEHS